MEEIQPKNAKASTYNKEKYQANKEKILAYRKERYKQLHAYKYDIKITNYDNKFNEIPFKKDTLLAMRALNRFSSENSISTNDTLELFSEYIGSPFFEHTDEYT